MNLIVEAVKNIYNNGNTTLRFKTNPRWEIRFYIGDNGKLNISSKQDYGNNLIQETIFSDVVDVDIFQETIYLDIKEGISNISLLVYYSLCDQERINDQVVLTTDDKDFNEKMLMTSINELYNQLIPLISVEKENIEHLAKCDNYHQICQTLMNQTKYNNEVHTMLSIQEIIKSLIDNYAKFEKTVNEAHALWKKVGEGSVKESNDSYDKWDNFLNQLYFNQFLNKSTIDLDSIDIDYEFLTSKQYISDPSIAREDEIENLEIALLTPSKSAILVGPPGVGKTAVVEGLAYRISSGLVPSALQNIKILKINTSSIVRGCTLVGMFEEKVDKIMQYLAKHPNIILFVDEIHTAIGAGLGSVGCLDLANIMKPYIDRGQKVIGATTKEEYDKHIKKDNAFNRRFQITTISEPQENALRQIIRETIRKFEQMTNIKWNFDTDISEIIINHIVECTDEKHRNFDDKRYNPDISINILENVFAIARLRGLDSVSVENVADAIKRSEFLYESVRMDSVDELLCKCSFSDSDEPIGQNKCKIIKFPNSWK